jgi:asparagine synthase (glutamine-hydrolysing)
VAPDRSVALGHRRLSIVDLSSAGHQPMPNEDGSVWISYNGEIYNHLALRRELEDKGHGYRSRTDTETILHLYEEEGPRCVERLQGMFAFAIWDSARRELFLARDRIGIKPLYFADLADGFLFASEIKALLEHPRISADLDEEAFFHWLTFLATPPPLTIFKGISKLAPGERMTVRSDGRLTRERYWSPLSPATAREVDGLSEQEMESRLMELLRASIRKRMMADVPFGVFLSGGVDSSTNVALMSEMIDRPVRTYSVGFKEHEKYNELEYAREIARRFRTDHHEVILDWEDLDAFVPRLVHHQDEPIADWVCVPTYYVSKLARDDGTIVVQVGEGSDELFHGYDRYMMYARDIRRYFEPAQRIPRPLRLLAARALRRAAGRWDRLAWAADAVTEIANGRQHFWGGTLSYKGALKERLLCTNGDAPDSYDIVERFWNEASEALPDADLLQKMSYLELKQRLPELLLMRVDKMSMATSVEARVPFLDHELVEFAMALPERMKVRDGVGKYLLKRSVDGLLPSEVVYRPKQGFSAPVSEWLRGELGTRIQKRIRDSSLRERGLLDYDVLDRFWDEHRARQGEWSRQLWSIYNLSAWHDYWVAGRELAPAK